MKVDLIYLFYECEGSNIVNFADDTTPYDCGEYMKKNAWTIYGEYMGCSMEITIISFQIVQIVSKQTHKSQPRKISYFAQ